MVASMSCAEEYSDYVDSDEIKELYTDYEQKSGGNRTLASKDCGITPASVYNWDTLKEDVKHSTKVKILENLLEKYPAETFEHITQNLYDKCTEVLLSCISTIYERTFDTTSENEYLDSVHYFESVAKQYAGQIYHQHELEVNNMYLKLSQFAKSKNYDWKPKQTTLYGLNEVKQMIPQIISSWVYSGLPQTPEELANHTKFPLDIVAEVGSQLNQQLSSSESYPFGGVSVGIFLEGDKGMMMSTAATVRRGKPQLGV